MKLDYHEYATEHFKNLTKDHETALYFLKDLKFNLDFPEYQAIEVTTISTEIFAQTNC